MRITAPSLRSTYVQQPEMFTKLQVELLTGLLAAADHGDDKARSALESQLLHIQNTRHANPFVSCSLRWSVAQSFALFGDTPGYVLTVEGPRDRGFDFAAVREAHGMFGDAVDYLYEFGVPAILGGDFKVREVHHVRPFGAPTEMVYP